VVLGVGVVDLSWSRGEGRRAGGVLRWVMNTTTEHEKITIKDGDGREAAFSVVWTTSEHSAKAEVTSPLLAASGNGPDLVVTFRWDGCANWDFRPWDVLLHTCSISDIRAWGSLMLRLRQRAAALIPNFNEDVAE